MMKKKNAKAREAFLIDHVDRNQIGWPPIIKKMFFRNETYNAMTQVLLRLREQDYLAAYPSGLGRANYIRLASRAIKQKAERRASQAKPLGVEQLRNSLAALHFCCSTPIIRKRLTPHEVIDAYDEFPEPLMWQHPYYIDFDPVQNKRRLGMIFIEMSARIEKLLDKHADRLAQYREKYPGLKRMLDNDELMFAVISPHKRIVTQLSALLENENELFRFVREYPKCRPMHLPMLIEFIPAPRKKKSLK